MHQRHGTAVSCRHAEATISRVDAPMCTMLDLEMFSTMEVFFDDSCL